MGRQCIYCGGYQPSIGESWGGVGCSCATVPLIAIVKLIQKLRTDLESIKKYNIGYIYTWHGKTVDEIILDLVGATKCMDHYLKKVNGVWEIQYIDALVNADKVREDDLK